MGFSFFWGLEDEDAAVALASAVLVVVTGCSEAFAQERVDVGALLEVWSFEVLFVGFEGDFCCSLEAT